MTASERRKAIIDALCERRFETIENFACEFNVSKRTIRYDVEILSVDYPIYTTQGKGGGIHVMEGYRSDKTCLNCRQQELLERLLPKLKGKDAEVMKSILGAFGLKGAKK